MWGHTVNNKSVPCTSLASLQHSLSSQLLDFSPWVSAALRPLSRTDASDFGENTLVGKKKTPTIIMHSTSHTTCVIRSVNPVQMSSLCVAGVLSESCYLILAAEPSDCSSSPVCVTYKYSYPQISITRSASTRHLCETKGQSTLFLTVFIKCVCFSVCSGVRKSHILSPILMYPSILNDKTVSIWVVWLKLSFNLRHFHSHQLERGFGAQTAEWIYNSSSLYHFVNMLNSDDKAVREFARSSFFLDTRRLKVLEQQSRPGCFTNLMSSRAKTLLTLTSVTCSEFFLKGLTSAGDSFWQYYNSLTHPRLHKMSLHHLPSASAQRLN